MRISLSRCIGVQRQCCSGVTDRFIGKVITKKVEGKFRFQGLTTADNFCNKNSHTANNMQHDDWNVMKKFLAFISSWNVLQKWANKTPMHKYTPITTFMTVNKSLLLQGGEGGSEKDFRWIFSYPSIYWHISALMVLQQMMRFLGGKPKHTDKNILKLKILSFHSCS